MMQHGARHSSLGSRAARVFLVCAVGVFASPVAPAAWAQAAGPAAPARMSAAGPARPAGAAAEVVRWNREAFDLYEAGQTERALSLYMKAAARGDPSARYNVAVIRLRDDSRRPSLATAIGHLRASAQAGFAPAQLMLGALLESGRHVTASQSEATAWFAKAAEQGLVDAQLSLATQYYLGRGVAQDYAAAARWYLAAAEGGDVAAQYMAASMLATGLGVQRNLREALQWYTAAARQGDIAAREQARVLTERLAREQES